MMTYNDRLDAETAMSAWAETTQAPALALVQGDGLYRIAEAECDGTLIVLPDDQIVETVWTNHSKGIAALNVVNAYTVGCCYHETHSHQVSFRAPHGTKDLSQFLDEAILEANGHDCWKSCGDVGRTFIEAMCNGEDVSPWGGGLPIPEDVSEDGPSPVVVIRTDNGHYDTFSVPRGEAHVVVLDSEDRSEPEDLHKSFGDLIKIAEVEIEARLLLHRMLERIDDFAEECEIVQKTDTGVVWIILNDFRDQIAEIIGDA